MLSEADLTAHAATKAAEKFATLDISANNSLVDEEISALEEEGQAIREAGRACIDSLLEASAL